RAAPWWAKAATQALEANDFTGAIARAEAAERCGARGDDLVEALLARAEAHSWLADNPALCETAGRLAAVAKTVDQEAATLRWRALGAHRAGDTPKLEETLARACELCERHRDNDAAVGDAIRIATYALRAGAHARAEALVSFLESSDSPPESRGVRVFDEWLRWRAVRAEHAQETETAVHLYREASRRLRSAGNTRGDLAEQVNLSSELLTLGAYDEAAQTLEASLSECERLGLTYAVAATLNNLCVARLGLGRLDEALLAGRKAVATSAKGRHAMLEANSRDSTARVLLAGGHVQEAVSEAERALTLLPAAHPVALTARTSLADALLARRGAGDAALALAHARNVVEALDTDASRCREPASTLRVHIDALEANGLVDEARQAREEARGWVLERASKIRSEHYRRTFLEGALDVARILRRVSDVRPGRGSST
ncbi:MAG: hypothetical protein ACK6CU_11475, partial [Deltaproteobacteria bacterium]